MLLVSACLAGLSTRYDGTGFENDLVRDLVRAGRAVPVCPEQLGGLSTPRAPATFVGGDGRAVLDGSARLLTSDGTDVTEAFVRGARATLELARLCGATEAVFKERSPSCGLCFVHRDGALLPGAGVTTALLEREGIRVRTEEQLEK